MCIMTPEHKQTDRASLIINLYEQYDSSQLKNRPRQTDNKPLRAETYSVIAARTVKRRNVSVLRG